MSEDIPIAETPTAFQICSFNLEKKLRMQLETNSNKQLPFISINQAITLTLTEYESIT
jgi:hypothetical protein